MTGHEGGSIPPRAPADDDLHVVPINDLIDHDTISTCVCGPSIQPVKRDDGTIGWQTIHHSLDGREHHEP